MLTQPARAERTDHSAGATLAAFLGVLVTLAAIVVSARAAVESALDMGVMEMYADRDTGPGSRVGRTAWRNWAEQHGSMQLRDAIQAQVSAERLYERDIARAMTPGLAGTARCPNDFEYDSTLEIDYDAARGIFVRARTAAEESMRQLPAGSRIRVDPPTGCRLPGGWSGACVPVKLIRGEYSVRTCYRVEKEAPQ